LMILAAELVTSLVTTVEGSLFLSAIIIIRRFNAAL